MDTLDHTQRQQLQYYLWAEYLKEMRPMEERQYRPISEIPEEGIWHYYTGPSQRSSEHPWVLSFITVNGCLLKPSVQLDPSRHLRTVFGPDTDPEQELAKVIRDSHRIAEYLETLIEGQGRKLDPVIDAVARLHQDKYWDVVARSIATTTQDKDVMNINAIDPRNWFSDDLSWVLKSKHVSQSLSTYLSGAGQARCDLIQHPQVSEILAHPRNACVSRWPSPGQFTLSQGQQAAVTTATRLHDLCRGIVAVNGPPGTGKSTLVREVIAEHLVETAWRLCRLKTAPVSGPTITVGEVDLTVSLLPPQLKCLGIVVASDNNTAVENIARELPLQRCVDPTLNLEYFGAEASAIEEQRCWGLIAAVLGSRSRIQRWIRRAWFTDPKDKRCGVLRRRLWQEGDPDEPPWRYRRVKFEHQLEQALAAIRMPAQDDSARERARNELFALACEVRQAWFLRHRRALRVNLSLWVDMVTGKIPRPSPEIVQTLWDTFFLLVPVVSTTFASAGRLFQGVGVEGLDWLIVDEAGQILPHHPIGMLNRCRRALVVGDPMQLEPMPHLDANTHRMLQTVFPVPDPARLEHASAQTRADECSVFGTSTEDISGQSRWVGLPLRLHYRCDDPMFSTSNAISYDHSMIRVNRPDHDSPLIPSSWLQIRSDAGGRHFNRIQAHALCVLLSQLCNDNAGEIPDLFIIAPFNETVHEIRKEITRLNQRIGWIPPGSLDCWLASRTGTVHMFQGREADAVILVLGLDPARPMAAEWAGQRPNLVNVAATRGRQRIYVVGDKQAWLRYQSFSELDRQIERKANVEGAVI